ncbi:kynurenine formamidase isoform X4 [Rhea pennata]|uniref:kynurenine formamidase isoform X4 n=1 Tax=Rhea pennata TaxID=8795 RepID=UPI002E276162
MGRWQDMSREELEEQYSPSRWSPRLHPDAVVAAHEEAVTAGTRRAQAATQTLLHVPYGDSDGEKLDIYLPTDPSGTFPVLVYIHGGYWQCLSKDVSGFAAPALVSQGVAVVAVGYNIAPKGNMDEMVAQVQRSLAFLVQQYSQIRSHSGERCVRPGAHSAYLRERCAEHELGSCPEEQPHAVCHWSGACSCGLRSACGRGPARLTGVPPAVPGVLPVLVSSQALRLAGWTVSLLDLAGVDHFDIIEKLSQDSYVLTQQGWRACSGSVWKTG